MAKPKGGLTKWFKEEWVDIKTGKTVAAKMTKAEKTTAARKKTGPKRVKYAVTASGRRRKSTKKA